jgi:hypothetical protein
MLHLKLLVCIKLKQNLNLPFFVKVENRFYESGLSRRSLNLGVALSRGPEQDGGGLDQILFSGFES